MTSTKNLMDLKKKLDPPLITDRREATIFLYNIFGMQADIFGNEIKINSHSYQLHECIRTIFSLLDQSQEQISSLSPRELYGNLFNIDVFVGKGVYANVFGTHFISEEGFVVKSNSDSDLSQLKIEKGGDIQYTKLQKFDGAKHHSRKELLREYLINRYLNRYNTPIFQQTYAFINCSRVITDDDDEPVSFCTVSEPGVIVSQQIYGRSMTEWLKDRTTATTDIIKVTALLIYNLFNLHSVTGFTHYDLHTSNIIIEENDEEYSFPLGENYISSRFVPKIIDFGMSRIKMYGEVSYKTGTENYGVTDKPNFMYDIYKLIMGIVLFRDDMGFLTIPFFGKELKSKDVSAISRSKNRPVQNGSYKDKYLIVPDNVPISDLEYADFVLNHEKVLALLSQSPISDEYGLSSKDYYKQLHVNYKDYIFPVANLQQKYIFRRSEGSEQSFEGMRIVKEAMYFYPSQYMNYLEEVRVFKDFISDSIPAIVTLSKQGQNSQLTDTMYGTSEMRAIYLLVVDAIQHYTKLDFMKNVLRLTDESYNLYTNTVPDIIDLSFFTSYRSGENTRNLFDGVGDIPSEFDTCIHCR